MGFGGVIGGGPGVNLPRSKITRIGPVTVAVVERSNARLSKKANPGGSGGMHGSPGEHGSVGIRRLNAVFPAPMTCPKLTAIPSNCTVTSVPVDVLKPFCWTVKI